MKDIALELWRIVLVIIAIAAILWVAGLMLHSVSAQEPDLLTVRLTVRELDRGTPIEGATCYLLIGEDATRGYTDASGLIIWTVPSSFEYRIVVAPPDPNMVLGYSSSYLYAQNGDMGILQVPASVSQVAALCVVGRGEPGPTPTAVPTPSLEERAAELKAWAWTEVGMELRVFVEVGE